MFARGIVTALLAIGTLTACSGDVASHTVDTGDATDDVSRLPDPQDAAAFDVAKDGPKPTKDAAGEATPDATGGPTPDPADGSEGGQGTTEDDAAKPGIECTGLRCNGKCLLEDDCRSCAGATLLCAASRTCVSACAGCADKQGAAMPIGCYACDPNHQNPIGTCQYDDASDYCLSGSYFGAYPGGVAATRCPCTNGGLGACPGATQVCVPLGQSGTGTSFCLTCGEVTAANLQGQPCVGGGTCQSNQHVCR